MVREHFDDEYVRRSHGERYRSRASYKLLEMQDKDGLIRPGMTVAGAAPGGWSQVAAELVGDQGRIVASDIPPMDSIAGVDFVQGDFTDDLVFERLLSVIGEQGADLVISDIAPNVRLAKSTSLAVWDWRNWPWSWRNPYSNPGRTLVKLFHGRATPNTIGKCSPALTASKPKAQGFQSPSREVYLLGSGFQPWPPARNA